MEAPVCVPNGKVDCSVIAHGYLMDLKKNCNLVHLITLWVMKWDGQFVVNVDFNSTYRL